MIKENTRNQYQISQLTKKVTFDLKIEALDLKTEYVIQNIQYSMSASKY